MTERINGVFVTLEEDMRVDDAEFLYNAIRMIKGVLDVTPNHVDHNQYVIDMRVRHELRQKIFDALK